MANLPDLTARVRLDTSDVDRGLGGIKGALGKFGPALAGAFAVGGIVAFGKSAVTAGSDFSATMREVGAVAGVPQAELKVLSDLALKFGADTAFSAGEAGDAMLELAKGGLTVADIKAGALDATLTLAAAGGLGLGSAATFVGNTLNTFGLKADQAASVAAALAGGANASSASVESLGGALSQGGAAAKAAGLSIQETVAALAAFDNAGLKGNTSGTTLKTLLTRLVPSTKEAAKAMADLGLDFTRSDGSIVSLAEASEQLRTKLGPLSAEQKTLALNTIFGADAAQGALILADQGAAGLERLTAATSDQAAAADLAAVGQTGLKGALDAFGGSVDTVKIQAGTALEPFLESVTKGATTLVNGLVPALTGGGGAFRGIAASVAPFIARIAEVGRELGQKFAPLIGKAVAIFREELLPTIQRLIPILTPVVAFLLGVFGGAVAGAFNGALNVIKGVLNIINGVITTFSALLRGDFTAAFEGVKQIFQGAFQAILGLVQVFLNLSILRSFSLAFGALKALTTGLFTGIKALFTAGFGAINSATGAALGAVRGLFTGALNAVRSTVSSVFSGIRQSVSTAMIATRTQIGAVLAAIRTVFVSAFNAYRTVVTTVLGAIRTVIVTVFNAYVTVIRTVLSTIQGVVTGGFGAVRGVITGAVGAIRGVVTSGFAAVLGAIRGAVGQLSGIASAAFGAMRGAVSGGVQSVLGVARGLIGSIRGAFSGFGSLLSGAGRALMQGLASGVTSAGQKVIDAARAVVQKVKDLLPGSPIKDGPLRSWNKGGAGIRLMGLLRDGIVKGSPGVQAALSGALDGAGSMPTLGGVTRARAASLGSAATPAAGATYNVTVNAAGDGRSIAASAVTGLRRLELLTA